MQPNNVLNYAESLADCSYDVHKHEINTGRKYANMKSSVGGLMVISTS
jgi:hypothetical protein